MPRLTLSNVSIRYDGAPEPAVRDASLTITTGDFVVLTGRSGCGKTSLLNVVAGFADPSEGTASVDGRPIRGPGADRAVVLQTGALFPWFTVAENVAFPLRARGVSKAERRIRADELLAQVKLDGLGDKQIWQLSGGMRQRVGVARALAAEPDFLLMDEPLGALDALTRENMQTLLLDLWAARPLAVLMVTHGIEEALLLGTRIVVMAPAPGRITRVIEPAFARRWRAGEPVRSIKADPAFAAARAELGAAILEGEPA